MNKFLILNNYRKYFISLVNKTLIKEEICVSLSNGINIEEHVNTSTSY